MCIIRIFWHNSVHPQDTVKQVHYTLRSVIIMSKYSDGAHSNTTNRLFTCPVSIHMRYTPISQTLTTKKKKRFVY